MGWKRYCENFVIAISLAQIFIVVMCSHISLLFYSPLAEEWRNYIEEAIYHWRWCVSCLSVAQTWNDLWPFLLHMTWVTFGLSPHVLNDLWPFLLHMSWMTFDLSFSTWQCVITGTRSATCLDHSTTPATKVQSNASIILPHFKCTFDDMRKQPLSWLLGKWSSISRTVAWNWTFACRGLWGLGG